MKKYYDELFGSTEGTQSYYDFIRQYRKGCTLLEGASGTGDLLNLCAQDGSVKGFDLDREMIEEGYQKYPHLREKLVEGDFLTFVPNEKYDTFVCVGDSLNYLLTEEDLMRFVDQSVLFADRLILDCHHPYRLQEFKDDYYEEGSTESFDYAYQIEVDEEHLVHVINFLDGTFDSVYQWVFDPIMLADAYRNKGYDVELFTDFTIPGIAPEGEKVMFVITKGEKV